MSKSSSWPRFHWEDPFLMEQQLSDDERMVQDRVMPVMN